MKEFIKGLEPKYPNIKTFVYDFNTYTDIMIMPNIQREDLNENSTKEMLRQIIERKKHFILFSEEVIEKAHIEKKRLNLTVEFNTYKIKESFLYAEGALFRRMISAVKDPGKWAKKKEQNKKLIERIEKVEKEIIELNLVPYMLYDDDALYLVKKTQRQLLFIDINHINVANSQMMINNTKCKTIIKYIEHLTNVETKNKLSKLFEPQTESLKENYLSKIMRRTLERVEILLNSDVFDVELTKDNNLLESMTENNFEILIKYKLNEKEVSDNVIIKMTQHDKDRYHKAEVQKDNEYELNDGVFIKTNKEMLEITSMCNIENLKKQYPMIRSLKREFGPRN